MNNSTKTVSNVNQFFVCISRVYSKKHVKKERARERAELAKAWNLLDPLGKGRFAPFFHVYDQTNQSFSDRFNDRSPRRKANDRNASSKNSMVAN